MNRIITILLISITGVLHGCASNRSSFACPYRDDGLPCLSVLEVYERTDPISAPVGLPRADDSDVVLAEDGRLILKDPWRMPTIAAMPAEAILEDPVIMRIWVAPWQTPDGDLHLESYLLAEIAPRRWRVAREPPSPLPSLQLIPVPASSSTPPGGQP